MELEFSIANFRKIMAEISGKNRNVELLLASKDVPKNFLRDFIDATGHKIFGENYIQETLEKWVEIKSDFPDSRLHFIGRIQTKYIKKIVELCDVIESVESIEQLEKIRSEAAKIGKAALCFAQINIGNEPRKGGFAIEYFLQNPEKIRLFDGVMCIPPRQNAFLYFFMMAQFAKKYGLERISMGMSADYRSAIDFGATEVRIGSAIFGQRMAKVVNEDKNIEKI